MKKTILFFLLISAFTCKAQTPIQVVTGPGTTYVYVGSLTQPVNDGGNSQKIVIKIFGGSWFGDSDGETDFYISNRGGLTINETTQGSNSTGRFALKVYQNPNGVNIDFYIVPSSNDYASFAVTAFTFGFVQTPQFINITTQSTAPSGTDITSSVTINPIMVTNAFGNIGIGTENPASLLQVDDGCSKASIGDASGTALNYGTSYLGFNASRSGSSWTTNADGLNNGGGVIYSSIFGDMYFAAVPTTGSTGQTLTDANVANKIAMRIDHTDGAVYMKQAYVQISGWPDFVFKKNYSLRPLSEVKSYIEQNQHLPDMPAAEKVDKDGINLGEMNKALLKKVEELTLYLIEKDRQEKKQQQVNASLENKVQIQNARIDKLEKLLESLTNTTSQQKH